MRKLFLTPQMATAIAAAAFFFVLSPPCPAQMVGASGPHQYTLADAVRVLRIAVGQMAMPDQGPGIYDVNGDGLVTVADAVLALCEAVGLAPASPPNVGTSANPVLTVQTDNSSYATGQPVTVHVRFTNTTQKPLSWWFVGADLLNVIIRDANGSEVWDWANHHIHSYVVAKHTLSPGQSWSLDVVWNQKDDRGNPVPSGTYQAEGELDVMTGHGYSARVLFSIGGQSQGPQPQYLPLAGGNTWTFVDPTGAQPSRTIAVVGAKTEFGHEYAALSGTPDSPEAAFLRQPDDDLVLQLVGNQDSVRYHLLADAGSSWTFNLSGVPVHATMVDRDATLATPAGTFAHCLQVAFLSGPDTSWTEWLAPGVGWVGWDQRINVRVTSYRLARYLQAQQPPIGTITITPASATVPAGTQLRFTATVETMLAQPRAIPVLFTCDPTIGAITPDGLFAASRTVGAQGLVTASATVGNQTITAQAKVTIGPPTVEVLQPFSEANVLLGSVSVTPGGVGTDHLTFEVKVQFPNANWLPVTVATSAVGNTIYLVPLAQLRYPPLPVPFGPSPFDTTVTVGPLKPGDYSVVLVGEDGWISTTATVPATMPPMEG